MVCALIEKRVKKRELTNFMAKIQNLINNYEG